MSVVGSIFRTMFCERETCLLGHVPNATQYDAED